VVVVADHDPEWASAFGSESDRVAAALGTTAVAIEHIGSTAVPGLAAKPIIDLMVGLRSLAEADPCVRALSEIGYRRSPEGDFDGRVFLRRVGDDGAATHHLSLTEHDGAYWSDQLAFRDALRADPDLRARYGALKRTLAAEHEEPVAYTHAKTDLIREVLRSVGHTPRSGWAAESDVTFPSRPASSGGDD